MPSAGCPTTPTSYWDHSTETFIKSITFNRLADTFRHVVDYFKSDLFTQFLSLSGVFGHILVGDEFHHVQPDHLLLSEPKVKDIFTPKNTSSSSVPKPILPCFSAGFVLVSVMRFLGVPSSKCQRRTGWSCSTHTPSE